MSDEEIRGLALAVLRSIAPEIETDDLAGNRPLRQQVDLDSMDWLHFLIGLHERTGVEIPEVDYEKLTTLDEVVAYLGGKLPSKGV